MSEKRPHEGTEIVPGEEAKCARTEGQDRVPKRREIVEAKTKHKTPVIGIFLTPETVEQTVVYVMPLAALKPDQLAYLESHLGKTLADLVETDKTGGARYIDAMIELTTDNGETHSKTEMKWASDPSKTFLPRAAEICNKKTKGRIADAKTEVVARLFAFAQDI